MCVDLGKKAPSCSAFLIHQPNLPTCVYIYAGALIDVFPYTSIPLHSMRHHEPRKDGRYKVSCFSCLSMAAILVFFSFNNCSSFATFSLSISSVSRKSFSV